MVKISADHFSIAQICESGQCFRLQKQGEGKFELTAWGKYLEIEEKQTHVILDCSKEEFEGVWHSYFDFQTDYAVFTGSVDKGDTYLHKTVEFGRGIRILRQDLWEIIISFIISQQNNIKRIRKCIDGLCQAYGEKGVADNGKVYYTFPKAQILAKTGESDLRTLGLGYRSKYIANTATSVALKEVDLDAVKVMDYPDAKRELMKLCGIGEKVADCICLFALHHMDAFPVDTHIRRVLDREYPGGFPFEKYKGYAGVMQQYIFYYDLLN